MRGNPSKLIPAKKGEIRNPAGRPKKLINQVLFDMQAEGFTRLSKDHVAQAYEFLVTANYDRLKEVSEDKSLPIFLNVIAKAIMGKKGFEAIETILDRLYGKAISQVQVEITTKQVFKFGDTEIEFN